ncbi:prenyltransferase, partial [Methanosalsum natronophilum]
PLTGISTLIFSLSGEMVDRPYDIKAGKNGLVIRIGVKKSIVIVLLLHILLILNIAIISTLIENKGWYLFLFLMPYFLLLPKTFSFLLKGVDDRVNLVKGAKFNFNTFVVFSMMTIIGFITLAYIQ